MVVSSSCETAHPTHPQPLPGEPSQSRAEQSLLQVVAGRVEAWVVSAAPLCPGCTGNLCPPLNILGCHPQTWGRMSRCPSPCNCWSSRFHLWVSLACSLWPLGRGVWATWKIQKGILVGQNTSDGEFLLSTAMSTFSLYAQYFPPTVNWSCSLLKNLCGLE